MATLAEQGVELHLTVKRSTLPIWVCDRGLDGSKTEQAQGDNRFHRAENGGTSASTGLGLTLAKQCVELLEEKVSFQSRLGDGPGFCVQLLLLKQES